MHETRLVNAELSRTPSHTGAVGGDDRFYTIEVPRPNGKPATCEVSRRIGEDILRQMTENNWTAKGLTLRLFSNERPTKTRIQDFDSVIVDNGRHANTAMQKTPSTSAAAKRKEKSLE